MSRLLPWLARALALWLAAALLIHALALRDRWPIAAPLYYASPWPVVAGLALLLALYSLRRRRRCRALILALIFAASLTTWLRSSYLHPVPESTTPACRLVSWNAARPSLRLPGRIAYLQSFHADVLAIGESNVYSNDFPREWREGFPTHTLTQRSGMLLITPAPPVSVETGSLNQRGDYVLLRCLVKERTISLLMVDFDARPQISRAPAFARLAELVAAHRDEPLIVLGDFNTPRESVFFDPLRADFRDAFESAGHGFAETWPVPCPVLSLDRIWLGTRWRAVHCELGWSVQSDHRATLVDLAPR